MQGTEIGNDVNSMINPPVERLLEQADDSKFRLVAVGAKRARQINSYYGQLGEGLGRMIPPQVSSTARKPLSIALQEIEQGKIVAVTVSEEPPEEESESHEADEAPPSPELAG